MAQLALFMWCHHLSLGLSDAWGLRLHISISFAPFVMSKKGGEANGGYLSGFFSSEGAVRV
jgi:hypothetical protein